MVAANSPIAGPQELVLEIMRTFHAPRSLVFKAWTEPEHLMRWCAPHHFTVTHCSGELKPGGSWRSCMVSADGQALWVGGVYREIIKDERLVFTHAWDGKDGKPGHETLVTITFADEGSKTKMLFRQSGFKSVPSRDGHEGGWSEAFERLGRLVTELSTD